MELVRLKHEWRGSPKGTILKVNDDYAKTLFQRDVATTVVTESIAAIKDKLRRMVADRKHTRFKKKRIS